MNICNNPKTKEEKPFFKAGNLYFHHAGKNGYSIATKTPNELVALDNGEKWICNYPHQYTDVTDQYCLQKVT